MLRVGRNIIVSKAAKQGNFLAVRSLATYKTRTGLAGIPVDPDGRENLMKYSRQILSNVQKLPPCGYKTQVEQWYSFMLRTCEENTDVRIDFLRI